MKFKIGNRVVGKGTYEGTKIEGLSGTIVGNITYPNGNYNVRWDIFFPTFHDCGGRCETGHGWNVPQNNLKKGYPDWKKIIK